MPEEVYVVKRKDSTEETRESVREGLRAADGAGTVLSLRAGTAWQRICSRESAEEDREDGKGTWEAKTPRGRLKASAMASRAIARVSGCKYDRLDASQKTLSLSNHRVCKIGSFDCIWG